MPPVSRGRNGKKRKDGNGTAARSQMVSGRESASFGQLRSLLGAREHKEAVRDQFEKRAPSYDSYTVWNHDKRLIAETLRPVRALRSDAMCLDLGGGTGRLAERGRRIAGHWVVADLSFHMLRAVSEGIPLVEADGERLPFQPDTFDLIVECSMLQYADRDRVLSEAGRLLRADGTLTIAEKVLGDYEGVGAEWCIEVARLRNPLKHDVPTTPLFASLLRGHGYSVESSVELRRIYRQSIEEWISRAGTVPAKHQRRLRELINDPPPEVEETGFRVDGDYMHIPISWAVISAERAVQRPKPSLVVSIIPTRLVDDRLHIYVQERRAPVVREPDYFGSLEFPQGRIERGENFADAAKRELLEESGLRIRRPIRIANISTTRHTGGVTIEAVQPNQVVITHGRLNYLSLVFIVETSGKGAPTGAIDNRGRWVRREELSALVTGKQVYPLNQPMFEFVLANADSIERQLQADSGHR
jgi:ubiquinone/menaquinone biosynthesis C-methylase UbiE/8-oxo-dGTP pyrophosphatase MutT (NUDIX family)